MPLPVLAAGAAFLSAEGFLALTQMGILAGHSVLLAHECTQMVFSGPRKPMILRIEVTVWMRVRAAGGSQPAAGKPVCKASCTACCAADRLSPTYLQAPLTHCPSRSHILMSFSLGEQPASTSHNSSGEHSESSDQAVAAARGGLAFRG